MWACEHSGIYRADEYSDDESSCLFSGPGEVMVGRGEILVSGFLSRERAYFLKPNFWCTGPGLCLREQNLMSEE